MATCRRTRREQRNKQCRQIILCSSTYARSPYRKPGQIRRTQGTTLRQCTTDVRPHHGWHVPKKQVNRSHHLVTNRTHKPQTRKHKTNRQTNQKPPKATGMVTAAATTNHPPTKTNHLPRVSNPTALDPFRRSTSFVWRLSKWPVLWH